MLHINTISASCAVISLALLLKSSFKLETRKIFLLPFFLSALFASICIGVRPFYLLALIIPVILLLALRLKNFLGIKKILSISLLWIILVGTFGLLTNMVPYLIVDKPEAFFAGMSLLSQVPPPTGILKILYNIIIDFYKQPTLAILIITLSFVSSIYATKILVRSKNIIAVDYMTYSIIIFTLVIPMLLLFMILNRHYWSHYLQMFAPFWGMGLGFFLNKHA